MSRKEHHLTGSNKLIVSALVLSFLLGIAALMLGVIFPTNQFSDDDVSLVRKDVAILAEELSGLKLDNGNVLVPSTDGTTLTEAEVEEILNDILEGNPVHLVGPQGEAGQDGADGEDGKDGADGASGQDGANGQDGQSGQDGATGAQGEKGEQGATGATGAKGDQGDVGIAAIGTNSANILQLQNYTLSLSACAEGQTIKYVSSAWACAADIDTNTITIDTNTEYPALTVSQVTSGTATTESVISAKVLYGLLATYGGSVGTATCTSYSTTDGISHCTTYIINQLSGGISQLVEGTRITLRFTGTIAGNSQGAVLNVNSLGNKQIFYNGTSIPRNILQYGHVYEFVYTGGAWSLIGDPNMIYAPPNNFVTYLTSSGFNTISNANSLVTAFKQMPVGASFTINANSVPNSPKSSWGYSPTAMIYTFTRAYNSGSYLSIDVEARPADGNNYTWTGKWYQFSSTSYMYWNGWRQVASYEDVQSMIKPTDATLVGNYNGSWDIRDDQKHYAYMEIARNENNYFFDSCEDVLLERNFAIGPSGDIYDSNGDSYQTNADFVDSLWINVRGQVVGNYGSCSQINADGNYEFTDKWQVEVKSTSGTFFDTSSIESDTEVVRMYRNSSRDEGDGGNDMIVWYLKFPIDLVDSTVAPLGLAGGDSDAYTQWWYSYGDLNWTGYNYNDYQNQSNSYFGWWDDTDFQQECEAPYYSEGNCYDDSSFTQEPSTQTLVTLQQAGSGGSSGGGSGGGTGYLSVDDDGNLKLEDSSGAVTTFKIGNSTETYFSVNQTTGVVQIGNSSYVSGAVALILDSATAAPSNPENGAMYYDMPLDKFRCYEAGAWKDCITSSTPFRDNVLIGGEITDFTTKTANTYLPFALTANKGDTSLLANNTITIPEAGYYIISNTYGSQSSSTIGQKIHAIFVNGTVLTHHEMPSVSAPIFDNTVVRYLNVGDQVQFRYYQNAFGSSITTRPQWSIIRQGNSNLIDRPDLWTVGTEYDFGDGLYGQRFTGAVTTGTTAATKFGQNTYMIYTNLINPGSTTLKIVDDGGNLSTSGNTGGYKLGEIFYGTADNYLICASALIKNNGANNPLMLYVHSSLSNQLFNYDIWVKYTK